MLNELERAFLDASADLRARERQAAQRRTRLTIGGLSLALLLISAAAIIAFWQLNLAETSAREARAQRSGQLAFALLPFDQETWRRVQNLLGGEEGEYWQQTSANPYEARSDLEKALGKLIDYDRAHAAVRCIQQMGRKTELDPNLIIRALTSLKNGQHVDAYEIGELIKLLQDNPSTDEESLCGLEILFLPLLGEHRSAYPKALSRRLAENPDFFCELIRLLFRSKNSPEREEDTDHAPEEKKEAARKAYHLLHEWRIPPGTKRDGSYDGTTLTARVKAVKESCIESGHWDIAANQLGEVLFYAPRAADGLWIDPVCDILDSADGTRIRSGLTIEIFNSRGVFSYTAGKAEDEIANESDKIASEAENKGYSRLAQALKQLASSYRSDAERERKNSPYEGR